MAKEEKVKKGDMVVVYGTGKSKFLPLSDKGVPIHKVAADKLIAEGKATKEKPVAKKA